MNILHGMKDVEVRVPEKSQEDFKFRSASCLLKPHQFLQAVKQGVSSTEIEQPHVVAGTLPRIPGPPASTAYRLLLSKAV